MQSLTGSQLIILEVPRGLILWLLFTGISGTTVMCTGHVKQISYGHTLFHCQVSIIGIVHVHQNASHFRRLGLF